MNNVDATKSYSSEIELPNLNVNYFHENNIDQPLGIYFLPLIS